jgi:Fe-S-cluster containining protein
MDDAEIDRLLYSDGYRIARENLLREITAYTFTRAVHRLYESVDGLLDSFRNRSAAEGKPVVCRRGCHWCCYQPVFAATHELLFIREFVLRSFPEGKQEELLLRAREKAGLTLQKPVRELYLVRKACPFLYRGFCRIYEARPMACRIYLSSSAESCKQEYRDPGDREHIPELFRFPLQAGRMLNEGFVAFLRELGLHVTELPLEQGYSAMATLDQTIESWIGSR